MKETITPTNAEECPICKGDGYRFIGIQSQQCPACKGTGLKPISESGKTIEPELRKRFEREYRISQLPAVGDGDLAGEAFNGGENPRAVSAPESGKEEDYIHRDLPIMSFDAKRDCRTCHGTGEDRKTSCLCGCARNVVYRDKAASEQGITTPSPESVRGKTLSEIYDEADDAAGHVSFSEAKRIACEAVAAIAVAGRDEEIRSLVADVFDGSQMVWKDIKASRELFGRSIAYFGNLSTPLDALCNKVEIELPPKNDMEKGTALPSRMTMKGELAAKDALIATLRGALEKAQSEATEMESKLRNIHEICHDGLLAKQDLSSVVEALAHQAEGKEV